MWGSVHKTDSLTVLDDNFHNATKLAEFHVMYPHDEDPDADGTVRYSFDGRDVSEDEFTRLRAGLYLEYEGVEYVATVWWVEASSWRFDPEMTAGRFIDSYIPLY